MKKFSFDKIFFYLELPQRNSILDQSVLDSKFSRLEFLRKNLSLKVCFCVKIKSFQRGNNKIPKWVVSSFHLKFSHQIPAA